jgi:hypothetical protein
MIVSDRSIAQVDKMQRTRDRNEVRTLLKSNSNGKDPKSWKNSGVRMKRIWSDGLDGITNQLFTQRCTQSPPVSGKS